MPRKPTGSIVEPKRGRAWAIRFRAYGQRHFVSLGKPEDGWNRERAATELRHVLADVERGIWRPPEPEPAPVEPESEPSFHEFASKWLAARAPELAPKTVRDYEWSLVDHLLPFFATYRVSAITVRDVDRYKAAKLADGTLAAAQINKTIKRLAQILDVAIEYGLTDGANPARGRRRRVKEPKPRRTWVEPEQLGALLDGASPGHRPILATLAGAGLRVGEAVALTWGDVNLATGVLTVRHSKTDAGSGREIDLPGGLLDELKLYKAQSPRTGADDPVFTTRGYDGAASQQTADNVGRRLKTAISRANVELERLGIEPIEERVSPHSLRRTYASLRAALRDDPVYIAEQLGHEDPTFTFRVYQRSVKRRERLSGNYLEAFDQALEWAAMGSGGDSATVEASQAENGNRRASALASHNRNARPRSSAG
jgi:integrase